MRRVIQLLFAGMLLVFGVQSVHACTCGSVVAKDGSKISDEELRKVYLEQFDGALFIGEVAKIRKVKVNTDDTSMPLLRVTMKVEQFWRGVESPEFNIFTYYGAGSCGVSYVKGRKYFVFAQNLEWGLTTDSCTAFRSLKEASDFIKMLGEGKSFPPRAKPNNGMQRTRKSAGLSSSKARARR